MFAASKLKLLAFGLGFGVLMGTACEVGQADNPTPATDEIDAGCTALCEKRASCDDESEFDDCYDKCVGNLNRCNADESSEAAAGAEECAQNTCDDVWLCQVDDTFDCRF